MKSNIHLLILLQSILWGITSCSSSTESNTAPVVSGNYRYVGRSINGVPVIEGSFTVLLRNDSSLTGQKNLRAISGQSLDFSEAGTDTITGRLLPNGHLLVYLTQTVGPYLVIKGTLTDHIYSGERRTGSDTGISESLVGTFSATKQ
jgi:hypothetical protein